MKNLRSTPQDKTFFETYANLIPSIKKSGYAAQVISALTEVGGIYAAAYAALLPVAPAYAMIMAGAIALIGTAVIELGLRKLLPHSVDAVLYRRFTGLHVPMSVLILVSTLILLAASGFLSFQNSKTIVEQVTPEAEVDSLAMQTAQINFNAALQLADRQFSKDSSMIAQRYAALAGAATTAYDGKIAAQWTDYNNLKNREQRTGNSYATRKDQVKASIASLKAEKAQQLAQLEANKSQELAILQTDFKSKSAAARSEREGAIAEVKAADEAAASKRDGTVATYGGGLAYFTIICLVILVFSIILDRIHHKGSKITQKVSLSQYDIATPVWEEMWEAFRERLQYNIRSRINAFAERTPDAPLPVPRAPVYDATAITEEVDLIQYQQEEEEADKVIYLPKRRRIGFHTHGSGDPLGTRKEHRPHPKTEPPTERTSQELALYKQRLKMYKKRLAQQQRKARQQEEKNGIVNQRTEDAVLNNQRWVEHYEDLINQSTRES